MSAQGTYRFYSVKRQTILLVNREPLGRERVNEIFIDYTTHGNNAILALTTILKYEILIEDIEP